METIPISPSLLIDTCAACLPDSDETHGGPAEIEDAAEDLRDFAIVLARSAADSGRRTSFDEVLDAFGHTRETLTAIEDDD